jgi:hypothetical protein
MLEEIRSTLPTISTWIQTTIKVFGKSILLTKRLINILAKVYQWLSAVIPSKNYNGALKIRLENTGEWFINGARFAHWKLVAGNLLWVSGTRKSA